MLTRWICNQEVLKSFRWSVLPLRQLQFQRHEIGAPARGKGIYFYWIFQSQLRANYLQAYFVKFLIEFLASCYMQTIVDEIEMTQYSSFRFSGCARCELHITSRIGLYLVLERTNFGDFADRCQGFKIRQFNCTSEIYWIFVFMSMP